MDVEERNWSFDLLLHHELDFCKLTIQMLKETLQLPVTMFPDDKGVIHVANYSKGFSEAVVSTLCSKYCM